MEVISEAAPTQDAWVRQNNYGQRHDDMTLSFQTTGGTAYLTGCQLEVGDSGHPIRAQIAWGRTFTLSTVLFHIWTTVDEWTKLWTEW